MLDNLVATKRPQTAGGGLKGTNVKDVNLVAEKIVRTV